MSKSKIDTQNSLRVNYIIRLPRAGDKSNSCRFYKGFLLFVFQYRFPWESPARRFDCPVFFRRYFHFSLPVLYSSWPISVALSLHLGMNQCGSIFDSGISLRFSQHHILGEHSIRFSQIHLLYRRQGALIYEHRYHRGIYRKRLYA